ncbi:hypothetical protein CRH03_22205 [Clostridium sp. HMb25]|nr:hypothetical protein CRH03_22205 [Clostridium sp. HMb25]
MRIELTDTLIKCFVLYMFSVFFYNLIPFSATLVIGLFIVLILFVKLIQKTTTRRVLLLFYLVFMLLYTSFVTDNLTENFSDFVRISTVFLLIYCMSDSKISKNIIEALINNTKLIRRTSQIVSLITTVMLIMPSCYAVEASWGKTIDIFLGLHLACMLQQVVCVFAWLCIYSLFREGSLKRGKYFFCFHR